MLSYQNDPGLKARFVGHVERHRAQDQVLQGTYGEMYETDTGDVWKGCAIACSARSLDEIDGVPVKKSNQRHAHVAARLGIPLELAYLEDRIFEGLSAELAQEWPGRFARAIPVGRDLTMVWPRLALWLLSDPDSGVLRLAKREQTQKAIADVVALYQRWVGGDNPSAAEWRKARSAYAAAAYAADAAAYAADAAAYAADAAADAAYDAADAAYAAAAYAAAAAAAYAADAAADAADARQIHWSKVADKLVALLESA